MTRPFMVHENIAKELDSSETISLNSKNTDFAICPTKVVEIVPHAFSGTIAFQGGIGGGVTKDNIGYYPMGGTAYAVANADLTFSESSERARYLTYEPYLDVDVVVTRTAGSVSINCYGFGGVAPVM